MAIDVNDIDRKFIDSAGCECVIKDVDYDYNEITIEFYDADVESYVFSTVTTEMFFDEFIQWVD